MSILALLLLTGVAMAMIFMSDTETAINNNYRDSQQAYFAAYAGLQEARVRLMNSGGANDVHPTTMPTMGANTGVVYIRNRRAGENFTMAEIQNTGSQYFDDQFCQESFNGFPAGSANTPCSVAPGATYAKLLDSLDPNYSTNSALDYKWVRISMKNNLSTAPFSVDPASVNNTMPICWNGTKQVILPAGAACELYALQNLTTVYRLTSLAIGPTGSQRKLQMEVANNPPFITNAAVDSQDHVTLNGKLDVNGFDYCSCDVSDMSKCTTQPNGTLQCPSRPGKTCDNTKWSIYSSNTVEDPNKSETLTAGPNPPVVQNQPWLYDIPALIDTYRQGAVTPSWSCSPPSSPGGNANCGTHSGGVFGVPPAMPPSPPDNPVNDSSLGPQQPQVTYLPGNTQLTGGTVGNGILIVDGDLDIHGGLNFYGLIIVKGVVKFTGGGSDKTNIYGAVLAGQESYVDNVLGGSASIQFNVCALKQKQSPQPPTMLSMHELSF
jgi:hypothetical protein